MPFKTTEALENALVILQGMVEEKLQSNCYNTVGSFLTFYKDFKNTNPSSFHQFFRNYKPVVINQSLSCVGLSLDLVETLQNLKGHNWVQYPFVASCEEWTDKSDSECQDSPDTSDLKEHVLVALKFDLDGRFGVILLDLGYHVHFPIVVMEDECYPHTGKFTFSRNAKSHKEYSYRLTPGNKYVDWAIHETRQDKSTTCHSFIYIHQKFNSAVEVVEKKNVVYNFRTVVARGLQGPRAGFYCNFNGEERFTLFFKDGLSQKAECKIPYSYLEGDSKNNEFEAAVSKCAAQCGYSGSQLMQMFKDVLLAFRDVSFMPFMKCVNDVLESEIDSKLFLK